MEDVLLLENSYLMRRRSEKKRKCWVHSILCERSRLGEFHHLHGQLQEDGIKFFEYYRMSVGTFQYILNAISPSVEKWSNFREVITPEERLAVTVR